MSCLFLVDSFHCILLAIRFHLRLVKRCDFLLQIFGLCYLLFAFGLDNSLHYLMLCILFRMNHSSYIPMNILFHILLVHNLIRFQPLLLLCLLDILLHLVLLLVLMYFVCLFFHFLIVHSHFFLLPILFRLFLELMCVHALLLCLLHLSFLHMLCFHLRLLLK